MRDQRRTRSKLTREVIPKESDQDPDFAVTGSDRQRLLDVVFKLLDEI